MKANYIVKENVIVKEYENGDKENLCLIEDIDIVINRTRETLDRMEERLKNINELKEDSPLSIMFHDYANELNELNKIKLLNK